MSDLSPKLQAAEPRRAKAKGTRRKRRKWLRWLKMEPEETPEQKAEREAREAIEAREDFLAEFWNSLPASERIRMCEVGGIIHAAIKADKSPTLPLERRSGILGP